MGDGGGDFARIVVMAVSGWLGGGGVGGGVVGGGGGGALGDGGTLSSMPSMDKMLAHSAAGLMAYFVNYA